MRQWKGWLTDYLFFLPAVSHRLAQLLPWYFGIGLLQTQNTGIKVNGGSLTTASFFFFVAFYSGLLIFLEKTYEISIPADTTTVGETLWSMLHLGRLYMISITRHLIYIYICYSLRHHSSETKKEKTVWQHCLWMTVFW